MLYNFFSNNIIYSSIVRAKIQRCEYDVECDVTLYDIEDKNMMDTTQIRKCIHFHKIF